MLRRILHDEFQTDIRDPGYGRGCYIICGRTVAI